MQAQHPARILGGRAQLHDRDARGVRREHRVRVGDDLVELAEDTGLDLLVLDHRLDDQLAVRQIAQLGGESQLVDRAITLTFGDLSRADPAFQRLDQTGAARGDQRLGGLEDGDVDTGPGTDFGDTAAHLAGADDADALDR